MLRILACAFAVSVLALLSLALLSLTTTDGYGCETHCTAYERTLIDLAPTVSMSSVVLGAATLALASWRLAASRGRTVR